MYLDYCNEKAQEINVEEMLSEVSNSEFKKWFRDTVVFTNDLM